MECLLVDPDVMLKVEAVVVEVAEVVVEEEHLLPVFPFLFD